MVKPNINPERELYRIQNKLSVYFEHIQSIYDSMKMLNFDLPTDVEIFLASSFTIDSIREQYIATVDERCAYETTLEDNNLPSYQTLLAFEQLYTQIKYKVQLLTSDKHKNDTNCLNNSKGGFRNIKLPRLEMCIFDGTYENWPMFYETFRTVIHENPDLTDGEKIQYLLGRLSGKALAICQGIIPSAENYIVIWNALLNKYNDKRLLAASYLDTLMNLPAVDSSSPASLEQFIDKFSSIISALKQLKINSLEDLLFIYIGCKKVNLETVKAFEMSLNDNRSDMPTCVEFIDFIRKHSHILQRAHNLTNVKSVNQSRRNIGSNAIQSTMKSAGSRSNTNVKTFVTVQGHVKCVSCGNTDHNILVECPTFLSMSPHNRFSFIKRNKLCVKCLCDRHSVIDCQSTSKCDICLRSHHTLLHFNKGLSSINGNEPMINAASTSALNQSAVTLENEQIKCSGSLPAEGPRLPSDMHKDDFNGHCSADRPISLCAVDVGSAASDMPAGIQPATSVLLGTARCHVTDKAGIVSLVRAIIDSASQSDFITVDCCKRLNLPMFKTHNKFVSGVGDVTNPIEGFTRLTLRSRHNHDIKFTIQPFIVKRITDELPVSRIDTTHLDYLHNLPLADSYFFMPANIDLILGSDLFARILRPNKISRLPNEPVAIETLLGYIVIGQAPINNPIYNTVRSYCTIDKQTEFDVTQFFELEQVPNLKGSFSPEERDCEEHYVNTTYRDIKGRFVVSLPFKGDRTSLGDSIGNAKRRFLALERKLLADPSIKQEYDNVFIEYLQKGYLKVVGNISMALDKPHYVIPHHGVVRKDKTTSRLRIVLDGSSPTQNGISLNDILHVGPNLQNDLFRILLRFRLRPIAISADIRQMYLRILVQEKDLCFQRLLYRFHPNDQIQVYEMTRVPFGLCCSPFLAIRSIRQLATEESARYPHASEVAMRDIYMDDLATSCQSVEEGIQLSEQLIRMFAAGGFELVKFSSNSPKIMASIPPEHRVSEAVVFSPTDELKILGLRWLPAEDKFSFIVNPQYSQCTKRNMLSVIARLWDLLGFIAPVTLLAKLMVKSLWNENIDWDETPPSRIIKLWQNFVSELHLLQNIKLPRHVGITDDCVVSLLGFADASEVAYGGMVYVHVYFPKRNHTVMNLLCAKSRVTPSKSVVTVARLELCALLILAKLIRIVVESYTLPVCSLYAFTDSKVALAWVKGTPTRWQTFVANRVSQIQERIDPSNFYHISGRENPSDCLSRGLTPAQLLSHPSWFNGPKFAYQPRSKWPLNEVCFTGEIPEVKTLAMMTIDSPPLPLLCELANRVSTWNKLIRIVIYVLRFAKKLPKQFNVSHLEYAEFSVIRHLQSVHFANEIAKYKKGILLPRSFLRLNAFVDNQGVLRVGGRLTNASIAYDSQHPILLPRRDHIVNLIIDYYHRKYLHTGPQLLMSLLRQKYWILSARNIVRTRVQKCNICFKTRPTNQFPLMASLPACRVTEAKAFCHTGVDYAGPLAITPHRGRGIRSTKAYICLFVCLVTKAVHLELSSDLSAEAFLNSFKRFLARRGPVSVLYSDRGTNFIGAKSYLDNMYQLLDSEEYRDKFANELREHRIEFRMNPASAPHFGGIWEANIRGVKTHLAKIIGNQLLTYEEMLTVLTQIEALLNSRPLSVMSCDPAEPSALTPAHFLVLTPLKSLPAEDLSRNTINLIRRKRMVDHIIQSFWKRWKIEYLHTLQVRNKWIESNDSISTGSVVLLESENSAPLDWPLGVIERTFPGKDGIVRVVDVRTRSGLYRRPVVKVYPLPNQ